MIITSSTDSNKIIKESRFIIVECLLEVENENQKNRLDRLLDLYNMLVK